MTTSVSAAQPAPTDAEGRRARVAEFVFGRPVLTVFAIALAARLIVALGVSLVADGSVVPDDETYSRLAEQKAAGETGAWTEHDHELFRITATLTYPLTALYELIGPIELLGQVLVAFGGAATAAGVAWLVSRRLPARWAVGAGFVMALLPSQVLWSALILKDAVVWAVLGAIAVLVFLAGQAGRSPRLLAAVVAVGVLLLLLGHLRRHTLVVAAFALLLTGWVGVRRGVLVRWSGLAVFAVTIPWFLGLGPAGWDLARNPDLFERRVANTEGAETAVEPAKSHLEQLPRGLSAYLLEPYPWDNGSGNDYRLAQGENVLWYPLMLLGIAGLWALLRYPAVLAFPFVAGGGITLGYALSEGNIGTAYRHRGEIVWIVVLFAAFGALGMWTRWWSQGSRVGPPPGGTATAANT